MPDVDEQTKAMIKSLQYHRPNEATLAKIAALRESYSSTMQISGELVGPGRARSLAYTHLEKACMYAVKAVVIQEGEQVA